MFGLSLEAVTVTVSPNEALADDLTLLDGLRITELMYNAPGGGAYEYLEVQNIGDVSLDLTGVRLTDGVAFVFPLTILDPGAGVAVVSELASFEARYGVGLPVAGVYSGRLSDDGEKIVLTLPEPWQVAIQRFDFDGQWRAGADSGGRSLAILDSAGPYDPVEHGGWLVRIDAHAGTAVNRRPFE